MEKKGHIYSPKDSNKYGFMTPHAMLMGDSIRIWGGVRDKSGVSHIEYIDVDANNPHNIQKAGGG